MLNEKKWWRWIMRIDAVLLIVAVVAGISGAVLSTRFLGARAAATDASLRSRYESRAVVVAAADIPQGEPLDTTRLAVREMPREFLPEDAVPAERAGELIGKRTAVAIRRGTPVMTTALRHGSSQARLATTLVGTRRALTIAVDQMNSQAGNLQPGDWVDLYYSRSSGGDAVLVPLMQHVEVLAAGSTLLSDDGQFDSTAAGQNFGTITLGLSATDAARVLLAQQSGNLSVVLRSPDDASQIPDDPRNSRELLTPSRKVKSPPADGRVELLVGGNGDLTPEKSWLSVGQSRAVQVGDPT